MIALAKLAQKRDVRSDIFVSFDDGLLGKPKFFHDVIRVCHFMLSNISSGVAIIGAICSSRIFMVAAYEEPGPILRSVATFGAIRRAGRFTTTRLEDRSLAFSASQIAAKSLL